MRHAGSVSAAYTYNAPGFGRIETLLGFLGITDTSAAAKITNVHATDGVSFTAGLGTLLGASRGVRIEEDAANPVNNHSIVRLGDALALYGTYAGLQPTLSTGQIEAQLIASGYRERRLEEALDALRTVFIGSASNDTDKTPTADRDRFYTNLYALQNDAGFKASSGEVQLVQVNAAFAYAALGTTDTALAYRYALLELLPLAVVANTDAQNRTLYGDLTQLLSLYDPATGAGNLTEQWIADRAAMLDWLVVRNKTSATGAVTGGLSGRNIVEAVNYEDKASGTQVLVGVADQLNQRVQYVFGGGAAETIGGYGRKDHLYGGAGADTLNGQGGADHLEGNSGTDALNGGDGADTLLGGIGDDTLDGGLGNDQLKGGTGIDTYTFAGNWGSDTIEDSGGQGTIFVEGLGPLNGVGAKKVTADAWQTDDRRINYTLAANGTRNDLIITFSDRTDTITLRNWSPDKKLGITLDEVIAPAVTTATFAGDYAKATNPEGTTYQTTTNGYASTGASADAADVINGNAGAELLQGLGGNDGIAGNAGEDVVEGGDGADLLFGGLGRDILNGGAGNDFIFGSGAGLIDRPTSVSFAPPAAGGAEYARGFSWVVFEGGIDANGLQTYRVAGADASTAAGDAGNVIDGGAGDDRIDAGSGADIVHGGDDDDDIEGLAGNDVLFGDAGNDKVFGDGIDLAGYVETVPGPQHGNDILVGGAGNDSLVGQGGNDAAFRSLKSAA